MSTSIIVCAPGSEAKEWQRAAHGAFDVVKATTRAEAMNERPIEAGFVFFHLAERLGLSAADGRTERRPRESRLHRPALPADEPEASEHPDT